MNKYGFPYRGSKSRYAEKIIETLPSGKRLVDLFAGGGAITHCAVLSGKWESVLMNDREPLCTKFFADIVSGKYANEKRIIDRETFHAMKDIDPYVKWCYSFGNNGRSYVWGKDIEPIKVAASRLIMEDDWHKRYAAYRKLIKMVMKYGGNNRLERLQGLEGLERLQGLQRLQRLQGLLGLEGLERLEYSNIDYREYEHKDGDVVYCDPPYEPITSDGRKKCNDYGKTFDSEEFYNWVESRDYQVFFSSYEISRKLYSVVVAETVSTMSAKGVRKNTECLYSNKPMHADTSNQIYGQIEMACMASG